MTVNPVTAMITAMEPLSKMQWGKGCRRNCAVGALFCCTERLVFRYQDIKPVPGAI